MTGREHFAAAERLLGKARPTAEDLQRANAHASLALAAITAERLRFGTVAQDIEGYGR
jgi:hypothetical protein